MHSLPTELQFFGRELAFTGIKNIKTDWSIHSLHYHSSNNMPVETVHRMKDISFFKPVFPGVRDIWRGSLSGVGIGFQVGPFKDSLPYFSSPFLLVNCIAALSAPTPTHTHTPLSLRYLSGRVFVLDLISGSQADVDKFIRPGDVIDEINGISLRNSKSGQVPLHAHTVIIYWSFRVIWLFWYEI